MNTQEIAEKMVTYNKEGKFPDVYQDLYAEDFVSIEMPGAPNEIARGMEEVAKKGEWWMKTFEVHSVEVSDPLVADDWFAIRYSMDTTNRETGERKQESELGIYQVEDGKVVQEQFFYNLDI